MNSRLVVADCLLRVTMPRQERARAQAALVPEKQDACEDKWRSGQARSLFRPHKPRLSNRLIPTRITAMAENAPPATAGNTATDASRGMPYYERLRRDLRESLQKKRAIDHSLVGWECSTCKCKMLLTLIV